MLKLSQTIREHRHFLIVVIGLIIAMTFPTVVYVFRTDVFWLPTGRGDLFMKFWDAWYGKAILSGQADFYFTDLLFYPQGLSLAYHNLSVPHMLVFGLLQAIMPAANAYNVCYLLIIFFTTVSAYVYLLYLFEDKWICLFGAAVFGMSGYVVGRTSQPDVALIATLPLSLYCFHRGVLEDRWRFIICAGALTGVTVFIGMYTFVCIVLSLGLYILYFARSRWHSRTYWLRIIVMVVVIGVISILRIYPMIADSAALDRALDKSGQAEQDNDLLQYFINYENPVTMRLFTNRVAQRFIALRNPPLWWNTSYLGYVPLLLIGLGFLRPNTRRKMFPWLLLMLPFLILRLGSILTINGRQIGAIVLPKHLLDRLFPTVFEAFHATDHFQTGVLLPLAILSCFGLLAVMKRITEGRRVPVILILIGLLAFEYYRSLDPKIVTRDEVAFLEWLDAEEEGPIRLINLPMNRGNSKFYGYYQTLSGFPHAEGVASRTPPEAYTYIGSNLLLETWRNKESIVCEGANRGEYLAAVNQLESDGFSHIILHVQRPNAENIAASFLRNEQVYQDGFVKIFRLENLGESCP